MDPVSLAAALVGKIAWNEIFRKFGNDTLSDLGKASRARFLHYLQPDEQRKLVRHAVAIFSEEFLKELIDKAPDVSIPGFQTQLQRLIESATPEIAQWLRPDVRDVDLGPVATMWSGLRLDPLPGFDWKFVARSYERALRAYIAKNPELRAQLSIALQIDARNFAERSAPGFDLVGYRDFLIKKCGTIPLSALHASTYDRRIGLWNVFVPQSARESAPAPDIPRHMLHQLRREGQIAYVPGEEQIANLRESYQSSPAMPVTDILARRQRVVLLGKPGSGKTSLLKYVALQWANEKRGPLPLWIDLREYARQPASLKQFLETDVCFGLDARMTEEGLRDGSAALFLDGLDEVFEAPARRSIVEQIAAFSSRYPQAQIVVSSRIVGYEPGRLSGADFTHVTLEDFEDRQILAFLDKWHSMACEEAPDELALLLPRLLKAIKESPSIRELAGNPLLLTMMAILNRNQELPRDRVELYREASRVLLHEWDASRALLPTEIFARQEKEALLREVAGEMQQMEGGLAGNLIDHDRLRRVFVHFLSDLRIDRPYEKTDSLLRQLTERNFILCPTGADRFAFVHRTFLEYFCAAWFVDQYKERRTLTLEQLRDGLFAQHWKDEKWHEVLRLIAGMIDARHAGELIRFLASQNGRADKFANLMLAGGCLSEVRNRAPIREIDHSLRKMFIEKAMRFEPPYYYREFSDWTETGATRTQAVGWIAALWRSEETRQWLLCSAASDQDWIVRKAGLEELARGWKDHPDTLPFLKDRAKVEEERRVRTVAVEQVARAGKDDPQTPEWLKDVVAFGEDSDTRYTAVVELIKGCREDDTETLQFLRLRAVSDTSSSVRKQILFALAQAWKDKADAQALLKDRAYFDEDFDVREGAVQALAHGWKDDPDTPLLLKDLMSVDQSEWVRSAALRELARGWKGDSDTLPLLKESARSDKHESVRRDALRELVGGWKSDPDILPLVREHALSDQHRDVRCGGVIQLARGWRELPDTLTLLRFSARFDDDSQVRCEALEEVARGWREDPDTLPWLKECASNDRNAEITVRALRMVALGWTEDPDTLGWLKGLAVSGGHYMVREEAVKEVAQRWKDDLDTLPWLKERAGSDDVHVVRVTAIQEVASRWGGDPDTLTWLTACIMSGDTYDVRRLALQAVSRGWTDDAETLALLRDRACHDAELHVRKTAIEELAWGWRNHADTLPLIRDRARSDEHHHMRTSAVQIVSRYWKHDATVLQWLKDLARSVEDRSVQERALRELKWRWKDDPEVMAMVDEA